MRSLLVLVGAGIREPSDADDVIWTGLLYRGGVIPGSASRPVCGVGKRGENESGCDGGW